MPECIFLRNILMWLHIAWILSFSINLHYMLAHLSYGFGCLLNSLNFLGRCTKMSWIYHPKSTYSMVHLNFRLSFLSSIACVLLIGIYFIMFFSYLIKCDDVILFLEVFISISESEMWNPVSWSSVIDELHA